MSGPYQSRLFNFLNRQAIAINDRLGKTVRNLKVATSWGVQILLYPFYLLLQTARWTVIQIESKFADIKYQLPHHQEQSLKEKQPTNTTEIITNVQEEVQVSLIDNSDHLIIESFKNTNNNNLVKKEEKPAITPEKKASKIMAIACLIEKKSLVLVRENNEILDILEPEQQKKIAEILISKIAQSSLNIRRKNKKLQSSLPLITTNNDNILVPIRWFWQVMGWMQTSDIARNINLFGEGKLTYSDNNNPKNSPLNISKPTPIIINKLDSQIAKIEGRKLTKQEGENNELLIENDSYQIQVLILAALDYFFGAKNTSQPSLTPQSQNQKSNEPDPWLTWEDLANWQTVENSTEINEEKPLNLLTGQKLSQVKLQTLTGISNLIKQVTGQGNIEKKTEPKSEIQPANNDHKNKTLSLATFPNHNYGELNSITDSDDETYYNIEAKPEWIETKVKSIGYVKNSLEIVLEWLDKIILLLEEIILFIVSLIGKILRQK